MGDIEHEEAALMKADADIAEAERRIPEQMERAAELRRDGHDIGLAERTHQNLLETLKQWRAHRDPIRAELDRLRTGHRTGRWICVSWSARLAFSRSITTEVRGRPMGRRSPRVAFLGGSLLHW